MSSQSRELETSSVADHNATTTPPPAGSGSQTGAQESPSTSDIKLEYDVVPPDTGKGKAVPDNTAQGGSGHDPPREWERMSLLSRRNESDDRSRSHSISHRPTRRSDDEDTWDGLASEVKKVSGILSRSTEENAGLPVKPRSTHKCVEKEVSGTSRDQPLVRRPVTDSSYKK